MLSFRAASTKLLSFFLLGWIFLSGMGALSPVAAQVTQFAYVPPPNPNVVYAVGSSFPVTIEAQTSGGVRDSSFADPATITLLDQATGLPSDPAAQFVTAGGTNQVGSGAFFFDQGRLIFTVTLNTGSDGEYFKLGHASITTGAQFPTSVPYFQVRGASVTYYANDQNGDDKTAGYPTETDLLAPVTTGLTSSNKYVTVTATNGIAGSAAYVITGINGGYAHGGASILPNLQFSQQNPSSTPIVTAQVILDYDGNLSNYDNPVTSGPVSLQDTVYQQTDLGFNTYPSFSQMTSMSYLAGAPFQPFMTNGKIILRVWSENDPSNRILMRYNNIIAGNLSSIIIPYSAANSPPVKGFFRDGPGLVIPSGSSNSIAYVVKNQYNTGIISAEILIPNLPHTGSQRWFVSGAISCSPIGSASVVQASGAAPGTITLSLPTTLASNASVTLNIPFTASDTTYDSWSFPFVTSFVTTQDGAAAPTDSTEAVLSTLGVPPAPGSFAGMPVSLDAGGQSVSLSWSQPATTENPTGYVLDRSPGGGGFPQSLPFSQTTFVDPGLTNLTGYTYSIVTENAIAQSSPANAGPIVPFANPAAPGPVTAQTGGASVLLNWGAAAAGSYALGGYNIYSGTSPNPTNFLVQVAAGPTSYSDTAASSSVTNYYRIAAVDNQSVTGTPGSGAHISPYSAEVQGFPPGYPPSSLSVTLSSSIPPTLTTNWTAPVSNIGGTPVSYQVYRGVNANPSGVPLTVLPGATLSFGDDAVTAGSFYTYEVRGLYAGPVTTNAVGPVTGYVLPAAPTGLGAQGLPTSIVLDWNDNNPGEAVTQYRIYQDGVTVAVVNGAPPASGPLSLTGFVLGTNYSFEVSAVNAGGEGNKSSPATVSSLLPTAPTAPAASPNALNPLHIDLTWSAPTPSQANVTGYNVYRDTVSTGATKSPLAMGTALPPPAYTDSSPVSADAGKTYYYFIAAVNPGGEGPAASVTQMIPPNAPTGVNTSSTSATITVNWTARIGENVTGYKVYRVDPSGPTTVNFSVGSAVVSYNDGSASSGVNYSYFVTAQNTGGEGAESTPVVIGKLPATPSNFVVQGISASNAITLAWTDVTLANPNATGISLLVNDGSSTTTFGLGASAVQTIYSSTTPNTTYTFWLLTQNPYGSSALAGPVLQTTFPGAVVFNSVNLAANSVSQVFDWTLQAAPPVTVYNIYRRLSPSGTFTKIQTVAASPTPSIPLTLNIPSSPGQTFDYYMTASNAAGEGAASAVNQLAIPPSPPAGLTAVSGVSNILPPTVNLAWSPVSGQAVTAYNVYRSTSPTGPFGAPLASLGAVTVYSDTTAVDQTVYYYKVTANNGTESVLTLANAVTVTAYALPNPPASLAGVDGSSSVTLTWAAPSMTSYPIASYNVKLLQGGVTTALNASPVTNLNYTVSGLSNGQTFVLLMQSVDAQGHGGPYASPVTGRPTNRPGAPGLSAPVAGNQALQLSWTASTVGSYPVSLYTIYRQPPGSAITQVLSPTLGYVDTGLTNGVSYAYWMSAQDSTGITTGNHVSLNSVTLGGTAGTTLVNFPSAVTAIGGVGQVAVTWTDSYTGSANPADAYDIYRSSTGSSGSFTAIVTGILPGVQNYTDSASVTNGTLYYYYLVAHSGVLVSANSVTAAARPANPPNAPTSPVKNDGNNSVSLGWTAPAAVNNVPVSFYVVVRTDLPSGTPTPVGTVTSPAVTFVDSPSNGVTYSYQVYTVNSNGTTSVSGSPLIDASPFLMAAPAMQPSSSTNAAVTLDWNAIPYPASSTYPITVYRVFRRTATGTYNLASPLATPAAGPYPDPTGTAGTLYYYAVAGVDVNGNMGPLSSEVLDGPANAPPAPSPFVALAGNNQVLLDWAPVTTTTGGRLPVSQYLLFKNSSPLTVLPASQTWYLDTTTINSTLVNYSLQALDVTLQQNSFHLSAAATPTPDPVTPASTNLNPPTGLAAVDIDTTSILLTWDPPNDGRVIDRYVLYQGTSYNVSTTAGVTIANGPVSFPTSFVVPGLSPNRTYYFVIRALEAGTNTPSSLSNHAYAKTASTGGGGGGATVPGEMFFDLNLFLPPGQVLTIYYDPPETGTLTLNVYNIAGRRIYEFPAIPTLAGVTSSTTWDGRDKNGNLVASGLYLIEIKQGSFHQVKKVAVVK